jgi:hypothetical protein
LHGVGRLVYEKIGMWVSNRTGKKKIRRPSTSAGCLPTLTKKELVWDTKLEK